MLRIQLGGLASLVTSQHLSYAEESPSTRHHKKQYCLLGFYFSYSYLYISFDRVPPTISHIVPAGKDYYFFFKYKIYCLFSLKISIPCYKLNMHLVEIDQRAACSVVSIHVAYTIHLLEIIYILACCQLMRRMHPHMSGHRRVYARICIFMRHARMHARKGSAEGGTCTWLQFPSPAGTYVVLASYPPARMHACTKDDRPPLTPACELLLLLL